MPLRASLCLAAACLAAGAPSAAADDAPGRLQRITAAGIMRVCIWPQYYGITFRNPRSGKLSGVDERLSAELALELGVGVSHVDSSFSTFIDDLLSNRCDIAMFGVAMLPERAARVRFSRPYLRTDIWAVTTRTHPSVRSWHDIDRPGRLVAVQKDSFLEPVMKSTLRHAEIVAVEPPVTRERELRAGRIDVFMTDIAYSRHVADTAPWAKVMPPPQPVHPLHYAYAVAPGDDAWLTRIDRFVADIKRDGRLLAAAREHRLESFVVEQ